MEDIPKGATVVTYYRCSTGEQINSIEDQQSIVEKLVLEKELKVIETYVDQGISGGTVEDRSGLLRLMGDAIRGKFKYMLVHDVSRVSRGGTVDFFHIVRNLKDSGVLLYCCTKQMVVTHETSLLFAAEATFAQENNRAHARDITRTMLNNVQLRKMDPGRIAPFGFDRLRLKANSNPFEIIRYLENGSKQVIDAKTNKVRTTIPKGENYAKLKSDHVMLVPSLPERVKTVKRIFKLAKNAGYVAIVDALNQEGTPGPRGGKWCSSTIRDILLNPVYCGSIVYNRRPKHRYYGIVDGKPTPLSFLTSGKLNYERNDKNQWIIIPNAHEALVPEEEFQLIQQKVQSRNRSGIRSGRSKKHNYILSGMMKCGRCGSPMNGHTITCRRGPKIYYKYTCSAARRHGKSACARYSIPAEQLEDFAVSTIRKLLESKQATASVKRGVELQIERYMKDAKQDEIIRKELNVLKAEKKQLLKNLAKLSETQVAFLSDSITEMKEKEDDLREQLAKADNKIGAFDKNKLIKQAVKIYKEQLLTLKGKSGNALKEILRTLGVHLIYDPDRKRGFLKFHPFGQSASK